MDLHASLGDTSAKLGADVDPQMFSSDRLFRETFRPLGNQTVDALAGSRIQFCFQVYLGSLSCFTARSVLLSDFRFRLDCSGGFTGGMISALIGLVPDFTGRPASPTTLEEPRMDHCVSQSLRGQVHFRLLPHRTLRREEFLARRFGLPRFSDSVAPR
jgi:hypothetical protein